MKHIYVIISLVVIIIAAGLSACSDSSEDTVAGPGPSGCETGQEKNAAGACVDIVPKPCPEEDQVLGSDGVCKAPDPTECEPGQEKCGSTCVALCAADKVRNTTTCACDAKPPDSPTCTPPKVLRDNICQDPPPPTGQPQIKVSRTIPTIKQGEVWELRKDGSSGTTVAAATSQKIYYKLISYTGAAPAFDVSCGDGSKVKVEKSGTDAFKLTGAQPTEANAPAVCAITAKDAAGTVIATRDNINVKVEPNVIVFDAFEATKNVALVNNLASFMLTFKVKEGSSKKYKCISVVSDNACGIQDGSISCPIAGDGTEQPVAMTLTGKGTKLGKCKIKIHVVDAGDESILSPTKEAEVNVKEDFVLGKKLVKSATPTALDDLVDGASAETKTPIEKGDKIAILVTRGLGSGYTCTVPSDAAKLSVETDVAALAAAAGTDKVVCLIKADVEGGEVALNTVKVTVKSDSGWESETIDLKNFVFKPDPCKAPLELKIASIKVDENDLPDFPKPLSSSATPVTIPRNKAAYVTYKVIATDHGDNAGRFFFLSSQFSSSSAAGTGENNTTAAVRWPATHIPGEEPMSTIIVKDQLCPNRVPINYAITKKTECELGIVRGITIVVKNSGYDVCSSAREDISVDNFMSTWQLYLDPGSTDNVTAVDANNPFQPNSNTMCGEDVKDGNIHVNLWENCYEWVNVRLESLGGKITLTDGKEKTLFLDRTAKYWQDPDCNGDSRWSSCDQSFDILDVR